MLLQLLEENLDKDTGTAGGVLLIHMDDLKAGPADTVGGNESAKESCNVAQSICLVSVDRVVVVAEGLFKALGPDAIELAETLSHVAVKLAVCTLLRAAFDNHVA